MVKQQQKLEKRNTYIPTDASQVCSPVVLSLNREETLSEQGLKTFSNNLDVNQLSGKTEQNLRVFVINMLKLTEKEESEQWKKKKKTTKKK